MRRGLLAAAVVALLAALTHAQTPRRSVTITVDDLPKGGDGSSSAFDAVYAMNERLLRPFKDGRIPLTGFVNAHHEQALGAENEAGGEIANQRREPDRGGDEAEDEGS